MQKRRDIQGLRAIAVVAVLLFHAGVPIPGGFLGVDVFFVISGFVITGVLMRRPSERLWAGLGRFYVRRFRRLAPALAAVVVFTLLAAIPLLSAMRAQEIAAMTGLGATVGLANFVIAKNTGGYFDAPAQTNPLLNMWSLGVEEQFYVVFPVLILLTGILLGWRRITPIVLAAVIAALSIVSFLAALRGIPVSVAGILNLPFAGVNQIFEFVTGQTASSTNPQWLSEFYSPVTRAWEFGLGALAFLASGLAVRVSVLWANVLGIFGAMAIAVSFLVVTEFDKTPGWTTLAITAATALVAWSGTRETRASKILGARPMVSIGDHSYSLYLWHWPLIVLSAAAFPGQWWTPGAALLLTVFFAVLSFRILEKPIRNAPNASRRVAAIVVVLALVLPVGASVAIYRASAAHWGNSMLTAANETPSGRACEGLGEEFGECNVLTENAGTPIYLFGDSNATMIYAAVEQAAREVGSPLRASFHPGCVFFDMTEEKLTEYQRICVRWFDQRMTELQSAPPGIVVIGQTSRRWVPANLRVPVTEKERTQTFTRVAAGYTKTIKRLKSMGHHVVFVAPIYRFESPENALSPDLIPMWHYFVGDLSARKTDVSLVEPAQVEYRTLIEEITRKTGATLLTFDDYQCPNGTCVSVLNGIPVYRDVGHLSGPFGVIVAPLFTDAFRAMGASSVPTGN